MPHILDLSFIKVIHTAESGLRALEALGYEPKIRTMVWQQGEADARDIAGRENNRN